MEKLIFSFVCKNLRSISLNQMNVVFAALLTHLFRPNAGLYFADMCLAQIEHTEA